MPVPDPKATQEALEDAPPGTIDAQLSAGAEVFDEECGRCHGERGEGSEDAPRILGQAALGPASKHPFASAEDVFQFVSQNMPKDEPGSLATQQYWNVVAYLVTQSGARLDVPLSANTAMSVKLEAPKAQ